MNKRKILIRINEIIKIENGHPVTMDDRFIDANLDSLGTTIALITIDSEFHIFNSDDPGKDLADLDIKNLTIRDLVTKCILATTSTSMEQKIEIPT